MVKRVMGIIAITILGLGLLVVPAAATDVTAQNRIWVYGKTYSQTGEGCAGKAVENPYLEAKIAGRWVKVAKGKLVMNAGCKDANVEFPYKVRYRFTVDWLGTPQPGERWTRAEMRRTWLANGKSWKRPFTKKIYPSSEEHEADLYEGYLDSLTGN